jgi:Flp pilus assembly protein TadG
MTGTRRGASAVAVALSMTLLFGFAALVADIGYARVVRAELRAATDAGALAGVRALNQRDNGIFDAGAAAVEVTGLNAADGAAVAVAVTDTENDGVVVGVWSEGVFTPSTDAKVVNAVSVTATERTAASGLGSAAFGSETRIRARSIAKQGGRLGAAEVPFYLPFGLPACQMEAWPKETLVDMTFALNPATVDNVGWAILNGNVSTSALRSHLATMIPCMHDWYDLGKVTRAACGTIEIGDPIYLTNGDHHPVLSDLADLVPGGVDWDAEVWGPLPARNSKSTLTASNYGKTVAGPIPIFDGGAGYCNGAEAWNGQAVVTGFVWAAIYDIRTSGSSADRNIWLRIDPLSYRDIGVWHGGPDYGLVYRGPAVVVK